MRSTASFAFLALLFTGVDTYSQSPSGSIIFAEGFASLNTYTGPLPGFFESWCTDTEDGGRCVPTVMLDVYEPKKGKRVGVMFAWGKDFRSAAGTLQFKEFVLYDLKDGQLYTLSQDGGHPGDEPCSRRRDPARLRHVHSRAYRRRARQRWRRDVALKFLPDDVAGDPVALERIDR